MFYSHDKVGENNLLTRQLKMESTNEMQDVENQIMAIIFY